MNNERMSTNYNYYLLSEAYISRKGFLSYWKKMDDFYSGRQHTKFKEEVPRAMTNICKLDVQSKASKINGTPFALNFTAFDNNVSTLKLQKFDKYILSRLNESNFNYQACVNAYVFGTEITYYRWDEDETTIDGRYIGGLSIDSIDITKFRVANPSIQDIQKQKWVMFFKDEEVMSVRKRAKNDEIREQIVPDGLIDKENGETQQVEIAHKLITVYTRFFRINGEVFFQESTNDVEINDPIPLNPKLRNKKLKFKKVDSEFNSVYDYEIDAEDSIAQVHVFEDLTSKKYKEIKEKFNLYPFAIFTPNALRNSFFGKSDIEELIPNQKIINFLDSMIAMDASNTAWGKYIVKKGALQGQTINNKPGQIITDHYQGSQSGIKRLEGTQMNTTVMSFVDLLLTRTRNIYGMSEVFSGDTMSRDLSGYAIQLLQEQANTVIEQSQRLFWSYCVDKAFIRLLFYKFYFKETAYSYEINDKELKQDQMAYYKTLMDAKKQGINLTPNDLPVPTNNRVGLFNPSDYEGVSFDITVEAGRGIKYSEIVVADMVNTLFMNGNFANMDAHHLEAYLKLNPLFPESMKSDFKAIIENQKNDEISKYKSALEQAQMQINQASQYIQGLEAKLGVATDYTKNLEREFKNKITAQNDMIKKANLIINDYEQKAKTPIPQASNYAK